MSIKLSKIKYKTWYVIAMLGGVVLAKEAFASGNNASLGVIAGNLFDVDLTVKGIIQAISLMAGASLLMSSLIQYKKYRQNPIETRLSTVIFTFVIGVVLILFSFIPMSTTA